MEQIESIKASGGNDAVNRKYNPHPEKHPLPLADDDHGMERYIRNKWEKKSFMDAPVQPVSDTSVRGPSSAANIPQRSSSVPRVLRESDISQGLVTLRDMGFRDEDKNRRVLSQTRGNLESAVEILSKMPGQQPIVMQQNDHMTEQQKLTKMWSLGYKDESKCRDALRRTGGNLEVAIEILSKEINAPSEPILPLPPKNGTESLVDVSDNIFTAQPAVNPYKAQLQQQQQQQQQIPVQQQQIPVQQQQMPMQQQLQLQQPVQMQMQTPINPFGNSFIGAPQSNGLNMMQNTSMPNQNAYPYGMNQTQPQVQQPQLTGFNQPVMNQYQPMQQQQQPSFLSNPFTQMSPSASTPTNSFGGVNPFGSQPMANGFSYNAQSAGGQPSPMNQPHAMPTRSYTSPDFNQNSNNHYFGRSNTATEFPMGSSGQNPFF